MAKLSSLKYENLGKGYLLDTDDDLFPKIIPANDQQFGIDDYSQLLYIFAISTIYKFDCEDIHTVYFGSTKQFIKAYTIIHNKPRFILFKSREMKSLLKDPWSFNEEFLFHLKKDLRSYYGNLVKPLAKKLLEEASFFDNKF